MPWPSSPWGRGGGNSHSSLASSLRSEASSRLTILHSGCSRPCDCQLDLPGGTLRLVNLTVQPCQVKRGREGERRGGREREREKEGSSRAEHAYLVTTDACMISAEAYAQGHLARALRQTPSYRKAPAARAYRGASREGKIAADRCSC